MRVNAHFAAPRPGNVGEWGAASANYSSHMLRAINDAVKRGAHLGLRAARS